MHAFQLCVCVCVCVCQGTANPMKGRQIREVQTGCLGELVVLTGLRLDFTHFKIPPLSPITLN